MSSVKPRTFESVWDAIEPDAAEAENLRLRAELMIAISERIAAGAWTQTVAASHCGISQPRLSDLLRGRISRFSLDALVNIAAALGLRIQLRIGAA